MTNQLLSLPDVQARLGGIGRTSLFGLLRTGELQSVRIGRRTMVPESEVHAFIDRKVAEQSRKQ